MSSNKKIMLSNYYINNISEMLSLKSDSRQNNKMKVLKIEN